MRPRHAVRAERYILIQLRFPQRCDDAPLAAFSPRAVRSVRVCAAHQTSSWMHAGRLEQHPPRAPSEKKRKNTLAIAAPRPHCHQRAREAGGGQWRAFRSRICPPQRSVVQRKPSRYCYWPSSSASPCARAPAPVHAREAWVPWPWAARPHAPVQKGSGAGLGRAAFLPAWSPPRPPLPPLPSPPLHHHHHHRLRRRHRALPYRVAPRPRPRSPAPRRPSKSVTAQDQDDRNRRAV